MKKNVLAVLILCLGMAACGDRQAKNEDLADTAYVKSVKTVDGGKVMKNGVEVLYFHGKQRCPTCRAIEKNAKEVVESAFGSQMKDGSVVFRSVSIDEDKKLADKYEVTWSSLFLVKYADGLETSENLTEFAFANARKHTDVFRSGLKKRIESCLAEDKPLNK